MEAFTLILFCVILLVCIVFRFSILYALIAGLVLFCLYACKQGFRGRQILQMCLDGIKTAKNVLITFLMIGVLTAIWRTAGTISTIISYALQLFTPSLFLVLAFLLNCGVSFLTGTAFGTAATMGVLCATMANSMGLSPVWLGGAVLAGAYFGDRCSPVSTSALLVAELTGTSIFSNIRTMLRTAVIPFLVACLLYLGAGFLLPHAPVSLAMQDTLQAEFTLHWIALLPALVIVVLSLFHVDVKRNMLASILSAIPICLLLQKAPVTQILHDILFGYEAKTAALAGIISGGGIFSMLRSAAIICISSAYSGIFQKTALLSSLQNKLQALAQKVTPFSAVLCTAVASSMLACNQTLAIMLTHQLCRSIAKDNKTFAVEIENTAVIIAPLVPWSIAGAVPLASIGAPNGSRFFAFFLYLLPLWHFLVTLRHRKKELSKPI